MTIISWLWKRIVIGPILELIREELAKRIMELVLTKGKGYWFFIQNYIISLVAATWFWTVIFSLLPDFYIYDLTWIPTLILISIVAVVNNILVFQSKKSKLHLLLMVLSFFASIYLYFPVFKPLSPIINILLKDQMSLVNTLGANIIAPLVLGKYHISLLGKTEMSFFHRIINSIGLGITLELSLLPTVFFQWIGLLFLPILPKYLEAEVYEGATYPKHVLEHVLKREAFPAVQEDMKFEGYHYYISSLNPPHVIIAFGDKTFLMKIKGTKLPFEEQLSILHKAKKEYSVRSKIYLTGISRNKIDASYEEIYEIKNIARSNRMISDGMYFYLPSEYKNVAFTDYFGRIKPVKDEFLGETRYRIKFREDLRKGQSIVLKMAYDVNFKRTKKSQERSKVEDLIVTLQSLIVGKLKTWAIEIISQCEIEFLDADPTPKKLDKKMIEFGFRKFKPKKKKYLKIRFKVQDNEKRT